MLTALHNSRQHPHEPQHERGCPHFDAGAQEATNGATNFPRKAHSRVGLAQEREALCWSVCTFDLLYGTSCAQHVT